MIYESYEYCRGTY